PYDRERSALVRRQTGARRAQEAVDHPLAPLVGVAVGEVAHEARLLPLVHGALAAREPRVDRCGRPCLVVGPVKRGQHELLELSKGAGECGRLLHGSAPYTTGAPCMEAARRAPA